MTASVRPLSRPGPLVAMLALACFVTAALACYWDRDTLRAEATGLESVIETITGRFDRFPPLYYEMRLDRISAIADEDLALSDYDDAGVAADRLGRSDEAIAWMDRKRSALDELAEADVEHEYRYLANLGTFYVHRWIGGGADRDDLADLERSRDLIAAAIELNPDAHFGRERYQLLAIDWLIELPEPDASVPTIFDSAETLSESDSGELRMRFAGQDVLNRNGFGDAAEGVGGLIRLGAAWSSVDIHQALALALHDRGLGPVSLLAKLRVEELRENGEVSFHPAIAAELNGYYFAAGHGVYYEEDVAAWFSEARDEADGWQMARNAYFMKRAALGRHPDTEPEFWEDWVSPSEPPEMPGNFLGMTWGQAVALNAVMALLGYVVLPIVSIVGFIRWLRRRLRARAA
ncbi:MAG: hypothetical protein AAGI17_05540 [Planctomycetota bacterium]